MSAQTVRLGLRERKRRRTFSEIQRVAMKLFAEQGYEETTIEQIAELAEVSPSTVFRYFPTKEDLVLTDEYDPALLASLAEGPPGETPVAAIRRAITQSMGSIFAEDRESILIRSRLMLAEPELRSRFYDTIHQTEDNLAQALAGHWGLEPTDFELRVAVGAIVGALTAVIVDWIESGAKSDPVAALDRAMAVLERGLKEVGRPARAR